MSNNSYVEIVCKKLGRIYIVKSLRFVVKLLFVHNLSIEIVNVNNIVSILNAVIAFKMNTMHVTSNKIMGVLYQHLLWFYTRSDV